jgi:hypothetical protein
VSQPYLAQIEGGARTGDVRLYVRMAQALRVRVEDLLADKGLLAFDSCSHLWGMAVRLHAASYCGGVPDAWWRTMSQRSPCFSRMLVARAVTFTASPFGRRPRSVSVPTTQATP